MRQLLIASLNGGWAGCGHGVEDEKKTLHKTLVCADCNRKKHFRFTVRPFQMDECFVVEPAKKTPGISWRQEIQVGSGLGFFACF